MKNIQLKTVIREKKGKKVKQLRKIGLIPATLYGFGINNPLSLTVSYGDFEPIYRQGGENTLINLNVKGDKDYNVVIHDIGIDPVSDKYIHADFYAVNMTEKIITKVPLKFEGVSDAVKNSGGVLVKSKDELEVESLPSDIPSEIIVDISKLKTFENIIRVADLLLSDKVEVLDDLNAAIATVAQPRSEEELKALDEKVEEKVVEVKEAGKEQTSEPSSEQEKQNE